MMSDPVTDREPLSEVAHPVLPLAVADLADGMAFGALAVSIGMGVLAPG